MPEREPIHQGSETGRVTAGGSQEPGSRRRAAIDRHAIEVAGADIHLGSLFEDDRPIELEIGCGKGAFLVTAAEMYPGVNFVGIEIAGAFARAAAERMARRSLSNVRVLIGDAGELVRDRLPSESLAALHVFFPDPWPKKRHHKRRLFSEPFLVAALRVLEPGGRLCVATDHREYYQLMRSLVDANGCFERLVAYEWRGEGGVTNFERKYLRAGRVSYRAAYRKRSPRSDWYRL